MQLMCPNLLHSKLRCIKLLLGACLFMCPDWEQIEPDRNSPGLIPCFTPCSSQEEFQAPVGSSPRLVGTGDSPKLVGGTGIRPGLWGVEEAVPTPGAALSCRELEASPELHTVGRCPQNWDSSPLPSGVWGWPRAPHSWKLPPEPWQLPLPGPPPRAWGLARQQLWPPAAWAAQEQFAPG